MVAEAWQRSQVPRHDKGGKGSRVVGELVCVLWCLVEVSKCMVKVTELMVRTHEA